MHRSDKNAQDLWRNLDWNDLRTFLAVAESGSLNAAARVLAMTQPTISRRMEDLEYRLGVRLFHRSTRGISLTTEGERVHDLAASMARFGETILRDVAGHDKEEGGRVKIAAPDGIGAFVVVPQLPAFQMANPLIDVALDCGLWPDSPLDGDVDLSLDLAAAASPELVSTPLATLHYALFASRDYLNVYGAPKTFAEAAEHRWVRHAHPKMQPATWHPKTSALRDLAGQQFLSNSSAATFQAVVNGAGLSSLPTYVTSIVPNLVMLDLEPLAHPILSLRYRASAAKLHRVARVRDWLGSIFDCTNQPWYREEFIHPRDFDRVRSLAPRQLAALA
jgi:DNA-binding transcriptional LysR family regulator